MPQMGRPRIVTKDGYHHHGGYGRWHPTDQRHGNKTDLLHKEFYSEMPRGDLRDQDSAAYEIFELVVALEKMQTVRILSSELQKSIESLWIFVILR